MEVLSKIDTAKIPDVVPTQVGKEGIFSSERKNKHKLRILEVI